jgi:hypothetical protein
MATRVDSRDVLDPTGKTKASFSAKIVGFYKRVGPNPWDDYKFVSRDGDTIDVRSELKVQMEKFGLAFRLRYQGKVVRLEWQPSAEDIQRAGDDDQATLRTFFLSHYILDFAEAGPQNAAALIANKLR